MANHLTSHLVRRRRFPPARLEVEIADLTGSPVLDFHQTIVVYGGVARDDSNDRGGDLLPGVQFLSAGDWSQLEEPCAQKVDVKRFAIEFGFERGLAL